MQKKRSSIIIDNIFLLLLLFVLSLIWIRFYVHNTFLIYIYSISFSLIIFIILQLFFKKKRKKLDLTKKEQQIINELSNLLTFQTKVQTLNFFQNIIKKYQYQTTKKSGMIIFDNKIICPNFTKMQIDDNSIIETVVKAKTNKLSNKTLIICGNSFSDGAKNIAKQITNYKIILYDKNEIYFNLIKHTNYEIKNKQEKIKQTKKQKFNNLLFIAFNKKKFKAYFLSAIILLIGSYFMRYNIYYLIMSSILLILSFFSYYNKYFNKEEKIFDIKNIAKKNQLEQNDLIDENKK